MASAGEYDIPADFNWVPEYDAVLEGIASTDVVDEEWGKLRNMIKYKIDKNITLFLSEQEKTRNLPPKSRVLAPQQLATGGLKLPPFTPRKRDTDPPIAFMDEMQTKEFKNIIYTQLHEFDEYPPFTIQRVCELCVRPKEQYRFVGKYLRAVEKVLLVTSTCDAFPPLSEKDQTLQSRIAISMGSAPPSAPATPLFSPIPFLHEDARRSKSRSPPPSPLVLPAATPTAGTEGLDQQSIGLGLVDELDDPSPGHMSEHPTALTSVTTLPPSQTSKPLFGGSLQERFVKSEPESGSNPPEVRDESMELDDAEDKENKA